MKIPLTEAYERATKGPLQLMGHEIMSPRGTVIAFCYDRGDTLAESNAALLAHAFNVLPDVVEALEVMIGLFPVRPSNDGGGTLGFLPHVTKAYDDAKEALAKASTVEVRE